MSELADRILSRRTSRVSILTLGTGNVRSLVISITRLGYEVDLATSPREFLDADIALVPGVAAWDTLLERIESGGFRDVFGKRVSDRRPLLGVCAGMQVLFESSAEGKRDGLGLLQGRVRDAREFGWATPRLGWECARWSESAFVRDVFGDPPPAGPFYFAHSFVCDPADKEIVMARSPLAAFSVAVGKDNLVGLQFHPERSGPDGEVVLGRVLRWMAQA